MVYTCALEEGLNVRATMILAPFGLQPGRQRKLRESHASTYTAPTHAHAYLYICYIHIHTYITTYLHTYIQTYINTYTYMNMYVDAHGGRYTYIPTHTHTHTRTLPYSCTACFCTKSCHRVVPLFRSGMFVHFLAHLLHGTYTWEGPGVPRKYMYIRTHAYVHAGTYVYVCVYKYMHMYAFMPQYVYVTIYIYIHVYLYTYRIYININTHMCM